jgi:hypothetical protein
MCIKFIISYFKKFDEMDKVQTKGMEKAIERSKDVTEAYLQGGKAIGEILKFKSKKNKLTLHNPSSFPSSF